MAKVVGFDESKKLKFTCRACTAIVEYAPNEAKENGNTDEGTRIKGLNCPNCGLFHRTNP